MDAYRPLPPHLRRGAKGLPRGGRALGGLRAAPHRDDADRLRQRVCGDPPAGRFRGDVPLLRRTPRPAPRAIRGVRPEAQRRAVVREVPRPARLRPQSAWMALVERDVEPKKQLKRRIAVKEAAPLDVRMGPPVARLEAPEQIEAGVRVPARPQ